MTATDKPAPNPVGWFEIYVADMDRAKGFYADVTGTRFTLAPMSGGEMEMWSSKWRARDVIEHVTSLRCG